MTALRTMAAAALAATLALTAPAGAAAATFAATSASAEAFAVREGTMFITDIRTPTADSPHDHAAHEHLAGERTSSQLRTQALAGTSSVENSTEEPAAPGDSYTALAPQRVVDSRTGFGVAGALAPAATVTFDPRTTQIPVEATAVALNVTGVNPTATTHLTVFPAGAPRPLASTLNLARGITRANAAVATLGDGRKVSLYNASGSAHLVVDVVGFFAPGVGDGFAATTPQRLHDSRISAGALAPGQQRTLTPQVPAGARAAVLNLTAVSATDIGHLTVSPAGEPVPTASALNYRRSAAIPNLVVATLSGPDAVNPGAFTLTNSRNASVHVIVDVVGYLHPEADGTFSAFTPTRQLDTRTGAGHLRLRLEPQQTISVAVADETATGGVLNVTALSATRPTHLTLFTGINRPLASTVNLAPGQVVANSAWTALESGHVQLFNASGFLDVVIDISGAFAPVQVPARPAAQEAPARDLGDASSFGNYTLRNGKVVRWNPCRTVDYSLNVDFAPAHFVEEVEESLRVLSAATGLRFRDVGRTRDLPVSSWLRTGPPNEATRRDRLIIAYGATHGSGKPGQSDLLEHDFVGGVGSATASGSGTGEIYSAFVLINNAAAENGSSTGFFAGTGVTLMHELGHAVGLLHAGDHRQVMYEAENGHVGAYWGAGDLNGLARAGKRAGCF